MGAPTAQAKGGYVVSACYCACSRCLAGDCCMNPRTWYPWNPVPSITWPTYPTTTTTSYLTINWMLPCSKCGANDIATQWHERGKKCKSDEGPRGEHLHRTCRNCGYTWRDPIRGAKAEGV